MEFRHAEEVLDVVEILTNRILEASNQRDQLIALARNMGASWHAISLAVHMTPQGANRRWKPQ